MAIRAPRIRCSCAGFAVIRSVPSASTAEPAIWAVYPPKKIVSSKVRAFVDFYAGVIGEPPYWDDGLASEAQA